MSTESYLFCRECKEYIDIAQVSIKHIYINPEKMYRFLERHKRHKLIYAWEDELIDEFDYKKFEGSEYE